MPSKSTRRSRWRCPACFAEILTHGGPPDCGCEMPTRWTTMEPVGRVRRTPQWKVVRATFTQGLLDQRKGANDR
jgi:hypothetical protein